MEYSSPTYLETILKQHKNLKIKKMLDRWDLNMLKRKGIPVNVLPKSIKVVTFDSLGTHYHGIAFKNIKGGWLVYEDMVLFREFTIGKKGMVYIPYKKTTASFKAQTCLVFVSVMDYLSFMTIQYFEPKEQFMFADCYILGDATVFLSCAKYSEQYSNIYCLFPYNNTGRMMYLTLKDVIQDGNVKDSNTYRDCENLENYLEIWRNNHKMQLRMV